MLHISVDLQNFRMQIHAYMSHMHQEHANVHAPQTCDCTYSPYRELCASCEYGEKGWKTWTVDGVGAAKHQVISGPVPFPWLWTPVTWLVSVTVPPPVFDVKVSRANYHTVYIWVTWGCQFLRSFDFMFTFECSPETHLWPLVLHVFVNEWRDSLRIWMWMCTKWGLAFAAFSHFLPMQCHIGMMRSSSSLCWSLRQTCCCCYQWHSSAVLPCCPGQHPECRALVLPQPANCHWLLNNGLCPDRACPLGCGRCIIGLARRESPLSDASCLRMETPLDRVPWGRLGDYWCSEKKVVSKYPSINDQMSE